MKTIFITGAAHGIGLATARRFAAQGWFVGLYDVNGEALDRLLESGEFPHCCGQRCDVTDRESIREALDHFSARTDGRLDVLVNNAGILASGKRDCCMGRNAVRVMMRNALLLLPFWWEDLNQRLLRLRRAAGCAVLASNNRARTKL